MGIYTTGLAAFYLPASGETGYKASFDAAMQAADNIITAAARRGNYVFTKYSPIASFPLSNVYATIPGSSVSFTPSSAAQKVKYSFNFHARYAGTLDPIIHVQLYRNGTVVGTPFTERWSANGEKRLTVIFIMDAWTGASTLELKARQFGTANAVTLHQLWLIDGVGGPGLLSDAYLEVSAAI
jgi:hypothetical protein